MKSIAEATQMADNSLEIKDTELLRSLDLMVDSWENDDLSIDDMTAQLTACNAIADGTSDLQLFKEDTNLRNEKLH